MPDRSRKPGERRDVNQWAFDVVREATKDHEPEDLSDQEREAQKEKDPAAVALGRKGGIKGGRARADKMTPEERKESARKAAAARWGRG